MKDVSKEELINRLPKEYPDIIDFIKERNNLDYYEVDIENNSLRIDEVSIEGRQYLIDICLNKNEIKFVDDLVDFDVVNNYKDGLDREEWDIAYNSLMDEIIKNGMLLTDCGNGGNEDYTWYCLKSNLKDFNKDSLVKCTKLWDDYNNGRRSIYEK